MSKKFARNLLIWGTVLFTAVFIILTIDTHRQLPKRTNSDKITQAVVDGKWVWQKKNCNDCHTILGIGGYYAPDVTNIYKLKGKEYITKFLKDPEGTKQMTRVMPDQHLSDADVANMVAYLEWVSEIDTNDWPPSPLVSTAVAGTTPSDSLKQKGEIIYKAQGCDGCHKIQGIGGTIGPVLDKVGAKRDSQWLHSQLENPKANNPKSLMPSFTHLKENEEEALIQYLSSLK